MINYKNFLFIFAAWTITSVFALATPDPPHPPKALSSDILVKDHVTDLIPALDHVSLSRNHTLVKRGLINSIFSDVIEPFILYDYDRDQLDTLAPGACIYGDTWHPDSGPAVQLCMQMDCNLVLYNCANDRFEQTAERALWASNTARSSNGDCHLVMQQDGNLVVYDSGNYKVWSYTDYPKGYENGPYRAVLQADGNFVVRGGDGTAVWDTMSDNNKCDSGIHIKNVC